MDTLPRWASASISAHCASLIAPALEKFWPSATQADRETLWSAIRVALSSAEQGRIESDVGRLEEETTRLVGRFELFQHARETNNAEMESVAYLSFPKDVEARTLKVVSAIIDVAARTLRIVKNEDRDIAFSECGDALEWARAVMDHLEDGPLIEGRLDELIDSLWDFCEESSVSDTDGIALKDGVWFVTKI